MLMNGFEYLTPEFFKFVFETMKRQILFVLAEDASGRPVAGALNFLGLSTLFGRYWGCLEEYRALHFELCYYQGIDYAIENKLQLFEAGAQGEHKVQRGFLPELTYSAHWIKDLNLDPAIRDFVKRERQQIQLVFEEYAEHTPFSAVFKVT
jgi:predicted N-acyltransferase